MIRIDLSRTCKLIFLSGNQKKSEGEKNKFKLSLGRGVVDGVKVRGDKYVILGLGQLFLGSKMIFYKKKEKYSTGLGVGGRGRVQWE